MIHPRTLDILEFPKIKEFIAGFCKTDSGRKMALDILPANTMDEANYLFALYREAQIFFSTSFGENNQPFSINYFPEIDSIFEKYEASYEGKHIYHPTLENFWSLREMLNLGNESHSAICINDADSKWPLLLELATKNPVPQEFLAALKRCISDDGLFKDESSPDLYQIRNEIRNIHRNCLARVKDFSKQYNLQFLLQDDFLTLSNDRYVLPLKSNFKGRIQGIIHDWSQTGETCYFEPFFLIEINNRLQELKFREREEERKILQYLESLFKQFFPDAKNILHLLATLDLLAAKISMAEALKCECISFSNSEEGSALYQARHPLLLMARKAQSSQPVVPVDLVLKPGEKTLIITGGNAGGKTVCLKTFGLICAMSLSGLPVPVEKGSFIPWFERIDSFIGDEQSIAENVSTFTAQITHLVKAWKHFNQNSLVLLDEFGAGTDPAEGSALAQALLDTLMDKNCFVLASTHFPALKNYALTKDGVRAATMLFAPETNRPLFKIAYDQVGESQALTIAREHGVPDEILVRAQHYLLQDGNSSSTIISKLNDLCVTRDKEILNLKEEQRKYEALIEKQKEKYEKEKSALREAVLNEIQSIRSSYNENRISAKNALRELHSLKETVVPEEKIETSLLPPLQNFKPGEEVFHTIFQKRGNITEIDLRKNRAKIDINGVHIWADKKLLKAVGEKSSEAKKISPVLSAINSSEALTYTVDLRGSRVSEALSILEKVIDKKILEGFTEIDIIHGKGTGALRKEIHSFLKHSPLVQTFNTASEEIGGDGVTIAYLK